MPPSDERPVTVYLLHLPNGEPMALTGTAALIWVLASDGEPDVAFALAELLGEQTENIRGHVTEHLTTLVGQGLLETSPVHSR